MGYGEKTKDAKFAKKALATLARKLEAKGYKVKIKEGGYFDMAIDGQVSHGYFKASNNLEAENILWEILHKDPNGYKFKALMEPEISTYVVKFVHAGKTYRINLDAYREWLKKKAVFRELFEINDPDEAEIFIRVNNRDLKSIARPDGHIILEPIEVLKQLGCIVRV